MPAEACIATVLNLHQPTGNLEDLLEHKEWEAREVLFAYDRIPRSLWGHEDLARIHLSMSGTLLELLSNPAFQSRVYGIVKCGDLLWHLRNPAIDILGTGYYHPVMPLIPKADQEEHLARWVGIARHLFGRDLFNGFWPPEMGFCMEMIPLLRKMGFTYVLVDSKHVEPVDTMRWEEVRYRPHLAKYQDSEIVVVVRDRDLSDAQEAGMDPGWFNYEVFERVKWCDFPPLITTCSDGENGGWFRNTSMAGNFWGVFYLPLLEMIRRKESGLRPVFIHDYIKKNGAHGYVKVREGAWNTGWHHGVGFVQWTGSKAQKEAFKRIAEVSVQVNAALLDAKEKKADAEVVRNLEEARWRLLRAETSCNFFWGADWVYRAHADMDQSLEWLTKAGY